MNKVRGQRSEVRGQKKILIVRLDRIGDVLLSTPVIKAVRDAYPESHIAFMVRPYARDIVEGNPYLNEVIIYDKAGKEKGLIGNLRFIFGLRKRNFDLVLILHPTARTHLVTFLARIPERVGYDRKWGILLTKRIPHTKHLGLRHEIDYTLDVLRYIGVRAQEKKLLVPIRPESEERARGIFSRYGVKDSDIVITVNPSASCVSKRWSAERFAKVCDALAKDRGARVIIISGAKDKSFGDRVAGSMTERNINLSGQTSVSDVASILKRSRLFISNDSGPVHIACAVETPVIAIFGRNDRGLSPERWGPTGGRDTVLHKDVGCDTCLAHNCDKGFKCLMAVSVDDVLNAAHKILG
jgi:heptosyltransferase II